MSAGFMRSSIEASADVNMEACNSNSEDRKFQQEMSSDLTRIISRGSKPKSIEDWIDSTFTPIVIQSELDEITNLFKSQWLTNQTGYGIEKDINGTKIKKFFTTMMQLYCSLNLLNATSDQSADDKCTGRLLRLVQ